MDATQRQERIRLLGSNLPADLGAAGPGLAGPEQDADPEAARLHTLLEVAFLAAAADGELADAEIDNLTANLEAWLGAAVGGDVLVKLFDHLASQLAEHGFAARLADAAGRLDDESRRVAYKLACVTVLVDMEVHDDELGVLGLIADAFAIPQDEAQATFDQLDDAVSALAAT